MRKVPKSEADIIRPTGPFKIKSRAQLEQEEKEQKTAPKAIPAAVITEDVVEAPTPVTIAAPSVNKTEPTKRLIDAIDEQDREEHPASIVEAIMARRRAKARIEAEPTEELSLHPEDAVTEGEEASEEAELQGLEEQDLEATRRNRIAEIRRKLHRRA